MINSSKSLSCTSPPSWERITRKGEFPSQRAGLSSVLHKNRLLVFGGVLDSEGDHHKMESVFYDDLFALDMERRRWFAVRLKKAGGSRRRKKKDTVKAENNGDVSDHDGEVCDRSESEDEGPQNDVEAVSSGWDLDKLRHDMFAFIDGSGNVVYEKIENYNGEDELSKSCGEEKEQKTSNSSCEVVGNAINKTVTIQKNRGIENINTTAVLQVDSKCLPKAVRRQMPLPRINSAMAVRGNTLFLYGGLVEVGDREVTLDDCWSIDLGKREKWVCIWPGTYHTQVWKGVNDDDSYISSDQGGEDENSVDEDFELDPIDEAEKDEEKTAEDERKKAKKAAKKTKEKEMKREIRHEIAELKETLGLDNVQRTPQMGESVAEFYARTTEYWSLEASKCVGNAVVDSGEGLSAKELAREGFILAKERYDELKPVLIRLVELEQMQRVGAEDKQRKKEKKSPKKDRLR